MINSKQTRTFSFLAGLLIAASALASCGETAANDPKDTAKTTDAVKTETEAVTDALPARAPLGLPEDLDFGGKDFRVLAYGSTIAEHYMFSDGENGDIMNDAVYSRRRAVEERLNVTLVHTLGTTDVNEVPGIIKKAVQAGDDAYDQAFFHSIAGISSTASGGYLYNLDTLPLIDMNAEWWNKTQMDALRLGNNTYYGCNDFNIPNVNVIYFNKELVGNYDLESPYDLVDAGKWTIDRFVAMTKTMTQDLDGDGKMNPETDLFGLSTDETSKFISFVTGAEQYITKRGNSGRIELAMNTEKMQKLVEIFADLASTDAAFIANAEFDPNGQLTMQSGRTLFFLNKLAFMENMRDFTVDFGFVPYPKYEEGQKDYHSINWGSLMGVPATITDPECVGAVLEALAYESKNAVLPTYYDVVLTEKLSRDENAVRMLDLIFGSICYEVGGNYFGFENGFFDLFYALPNLAVQQRSTDFASWYAKNEKNANKVIDNFYKALEKTENA